MIRTKEFLSQNIQEMTLALLNMARESCWNRISDNCIFILSEIENPESNFKQQSLRLKKIKDEQMPRTFEEVIQDLHLFYDKIYDINLYIFKAKRNETVIDIRYYLKSSIDHGDNFEAIKNQESMIHSKVSIPEFLSHGNAEKFDINWEHGGIGYRWRRFWRKRKLIKKIRLMENRKLRYKKGHL